MKRRTLEMDGTWTYKVELLRTKRAWMCITTCLSFSLSRRKVVPTRHLQRSYQSSLLYLKSVCNVHAPCGTCR